MFIVLWFLMAQTLLVACVFYFVLICKYFWLNVTRYTFFLAFFLNKNTKWKTRGDCGRTWHCANPKVVVPPATKAASSAIFLAEASMEEYPSPPPGVLITNGGRLDGVTGSSCSCDDKASHAGLRAASNRAACQDSTGKQFANTKFFFFFFFNPSADG